MYLKKFWFKITDNRKYQEIKYLEQRTKNMQSFKRKYEIEINKIQEKIKTQNSLNFLHSGHAGDIINSLPVIKQLSKSHKCNLYINLNKHINFYYKHPAGNVFLDKRIYEMLYPLLLKQKYINEVQIFNGQKIDIDFDLLRILPINLLFDNSTYASIITGVKINFGEKFIDAEDHQLKNKIIIQRSFRYRNYYIDYSFLNNFEDLYFVGTREEFNDLNSIVKNLKYYECKDFLDMANIIKSSKFVLANSSISFPIAEGLQTPRLLESSPDFPAAQPHGKNAFNFYFQSHFEEKFEFLYNN